LYKIYTNKQGLWNRLVPRPEKTTLMVNQIVRMGVELASVNWHLNVVIAL
jgi:hypothetical protein